MTVPAASSWSRKIDDGKVNDRQTSTRFREKRYLYVKHFLPEPILEYLQVYYQILRANSVFHTDDQCPLSLAVGGDPGLDAVLGWMTPHVSQLVGLELAPTYSYTRFYAKGDTLKRHSDRAACEVSVTVAIEIPPGAPPSILYLKPPSAAETAVEMSKGDGCVYAGAEVEHWREPFQEDGYIQLFLHFIDKNGKHFPEFVYDKRKYLGAPYAQSAALPNVPKFEKPELLGFSEQSVEVFLLLKDGHQQRISLNAKDPVLPSLLEAIAKKNDERIKTTVFNLVLGNAAGSFIFAASDLIAISTNPPILIDLAHSIGTRVTIPTSSMYPG